MCIRDRYNTCGCNNIAQGNYALKTNTTGYNNIAVGLNALKYNTTGGNNIAQGVGALQYNTTGNLNVALGGTAHRKNVTGTKNTAVGYRALYWNQYGCQNVAIGMNALSSATVCRNVAIGYNALGNNQTTYNTAIGYRAGCSITTGYCNTIIGSYAGCTTLANTIAIQAGSTLLKVDSTGALTVNGSPISGGGGGGGGGVLIPASAGPVTLYNNSDISDNNTSFAVTSSAVTLDAFDLTQYRTGKYIIQANTNTDIKSTEVFVAHNTSNVYITEYATLSTANLFSVDASVDASNVNILITTYTTNVSVQFVRTLVSLVPGSGTGSNTSVDLNI